MAMNQRMTGTDEDLVPLFRHLAIKNDAKSREAGRPIFDDVEIVEIRKPGAKDWQPYPATALSHWDNDIFTGEQKPVTYAERFKRQYQQFKLQVAQTKSGTPLAEVKFLTEARRAELRALNIYTVEQLANIDGQELKNLGPGGRDMKNQAADYIAECQQLAPSLARQAQIEADLAKAQAELEALRLKNSESADSQFDEMSNLQIKDLIEKESGVRPLGNPSRKTLIRMATGEQRVIDPKPSIGETA